MLPRFYIKGMTAVEMIIVIALFTILSLLLFSSVQFLYQADGYSTAQANEVDSARRGMTALSRDMREMAYAEDGTFPIAIKEPHRIGFYSDYDKDNLVEYVEYELIGTTLYKRTYKPVGTPPVYSATPERQDIISIYVQNILQGTSTFMYFDSNGALLNNTSLLTEVRYIRTQLIVNIDPLRSPGEFMLRSSIAPRNLKDNL